MENVKFLKAWILYLVFTVVGGIVAGFVVGFILGFVMSMMGFDHRTIGLMGGIAGWLVSLPISYYFFRYTIDRYIFTQLPQNQPTVTPATL